MPRKPTGDGAGPTRPYDVGYGKPPQAHQFKKGQSGNPRGRPKKVPTVESHISKELNRMIQVTEDGERCSMSMMQLLVKQAVKKAVSGDFRHVQLVVRLQQVSAEQQRSAEAAQAAAAKGPMANLPAFEKLPTEDLEILQQAAWILDRLESGGGRPPVPLPPTGPEKPIWEEMGYASVDDE